MVSLDYTILIQMANFILLIFILKKLLYVPILGVMNERKERMEADDGDVKRLNQEVEQKFSEYEEKMRLAKLDAMEQRNTVVKEGADLAKSMIDAVRNEIPALMEQFNARIAGEVDAARTVLHSQSRKISLEIAEKVLGRGIQ